MQMTNNDRQPSNGTVSHQRYSSKAGWTIGLYRRDMITENAHWQSKDKKHLKAPSVTSYACTRTRYARTRHVSKIKKPTARSDRTMQLRQIITAHHISRYTT